MYNYILPAVKVSAVCTAIVDPAVLMTLTVMVYLLSSLRSLSVCDLMEPSEMVSVNGPPAPEHLLMVYLWVISKLSMTPDTVQVMVRVVAVGDVTWRLFTGPGAVTGGSVGMGPAVVGPAIVGSVGVVMAVGGADGEKNSAIMVEEERYTCSTLKVVKTTTNQNNNNKNMRICTAVNRTLFQLDQVCRFF